MKRFPRSLLIAMLLALISCASAQQTQMPTTVPVWTPPRHCANDETENGLAKWWHIFTYDLMTGQSFQLTDGQVYDSSPAFSPDGKRLAFVRNNSTIQVMDVSTREIKPLIERKGHLSELRWSPDGEHLAFVADWSNALKIYIMNADGTGIKQLTEREVSEHSPYWSPNGKQIAFVSTSARPSGMSTIYTATVSSEPTVAEILTRWCDDPTSNRPCESFYSLAWSPDGRMLAVVTQSHGWGSVPPPKEHPPIISDQEGIGIVIVNIAETMKQPRLVAWNVLGGFHSISWSPDGNNLLYYSGCVCGFENISLIEIATGGTNLLLGSHEETGHVITDPAWSPDGTTVVYSQAHCSW